MLGQFREKGLHRVKGTWTTHLDGMFYVWQRFQYTSMDAKVVALTMLYFRTCYYFNIVNPGNVEALTIVQ